MTTPEVKAVNIWSGAKGLAAALTNMTERARKKGGLQNAYPLRVDGITYVDSEAAYQALKRAGEDAYNDRLMVDLVALKLEQHPRLFAAVEANGGCAWLVQCSHHVGARSLRAQSWEGDGLASRFIRNLVEGYRKAEHHKSP